MVDFARLNRQKAIFDEISSERAKQDRKFGDQEWNSDLRWNAILLEEAGEVSQAMVEGTFPQAKSQHPVSDDRLFQEVRYELIQTAAVAVAWIEQLDKRGKLK